MGWPEKSVMPAGRAVLSDQQWEILAEWAEDNEYWARVQDFMKEVGGRELASLSVRQLEWYNKIDDELDGEVEKRGSCRR